METKVSVVIRNKNQADALEFLLRNLRERYDQCISEIIVIDNLSTDKSKAISLKYDAKFVTINDFGYGSSANTAAENATNKIVVIFSAHAYPVSHDFFDEIVRRFNANENLAGLRCLHTSNDYKNYINEISVLQDPNKSGLIFCGSAFNREIWKKHRFKDDITTFEDKEWTLRVLKHGYDIEFSPSIFNYDIKRTKKQQFFRFKKELLGSYQLWHKDLVFGQVIKTGVLECLGIIRACIIDLFYALNRLFFKIKFLLNKPDKY
ncbi:glycosyltransferase [Winogradskyella sp. DF17]|uniref:Glycosyltransferase n=1 Tax=Winogradskyella pelagia TaxID=2819984 RepID=A0ABS3T1Q9_9FLAO|nr:glycosyltransferase [Winogradskyella sp. DF17]MBO3116685.1 glycosyltransferase [Winogradskyella sp. DF17]